jgi:ABC-type polysaccharide/polyol phosphate transport system ATPase subunit
MSSQSRVVFDRVWKKFRRGEKHDSLRDLIPALARRVAGRVTKSTDLATDDFWAVRDLSFEVLPGQTLGIIGPNGSGKSTTLRMLTKILEPTRGQCSFHGRMGALIEVSAGFHADLTGRENVFLQGAIMGMPTSHIERKFDEIVDFSGISEFIDTPVKRYSSGMNARLGFSIAAHLEPDVLVIDEVLAVGDMSFQERAFGRIRDLARSGIPVVIVSHQLERVVELCTTAILLRRGEVAYRGAPMDTVRAYVQGLHAAKSTVRRDPEQSVEILDVRRVDDRPVRTGEVCSVEVRGRILMPLNASVDPVLIRVRSMATGMMLYCVQSRMVGATFPASGDFAVRIDLQMNTTAGGFMIDAVGYDGMAQREVGTPHTIMVEVTNDPVSFWGSHHMHASATTLTRV